MVDAAQRLAEEAKRARDVADREWRVPGSPDDALVELLGGSTGSCCRRGSTDPLVGDGVGSAELRTSNGMGRKGAGRSGSMPEHVPKMRWSTLAARYPRRAVARRLTAMAGGRDVDGGLYRGATPGIWCGAFRNGCAGFVMNSLANKPI